MVRHPRHVVYMLHQLRGLYDTYDIDRLPPRIADPPPRGAGAAGVHGAARRPAPEALPSSSSAWPRCASRRAPATTCSRSPARSSASSCTCSTTSGSRRREISPLRRDLGDRRADAPATSRRAPTSSSPTPRRGWRASGPRARRATSSRPAGSTLRSGSSLLIAAMEHVSAGRRAADRRQRARRGAAARAGGGRPADRVLRARRRRAAGGALRGRAGRGLHPVPGGLRARHARGDARGQAGDHLHGLGRHDRAGLRRRDRAASWSRSPEALGAAIERCGPAAARAPRMGAPRASGRTRVTWDGVVEAAHPGAVTRAQAARRHVLPGPPAARRRPGAHRRPLPRARARRASTSRSSRSSPFDGARTASPRSRPACASRRVPMTAEHHRAEYPLRIARRRPRPRPRAGAARATSRPPTARRSRRSPRRAVAAVACHPFAQPAAGGLDRRCR